MASRKLTKIVDLRAYVLDAGEQGADYHAREGGHWINSTVIANPMSKYPEYHDDRVSWGIDVLGSVMVEVEAADGTVGFAVTTGGVPAAYLIEKHFRRFVVGQLANNIELMFDQMYNASLYYGRKGITIKAISAVDCALWDLLGRLRQEPVWAMIGGKMRERQPMYATGPRPDLAKELGFIGAKIPLPYGPAQGEAGLRENVALARKWREACGDDFMLAFDCFMALDTRYTLRLIEALEPLRFHWIEECLPPDDYRGYAQLVRQRSHSIMISTGEHEYTRWGFEQLLETGVDIVQPDAWCGGLTEMLKVRALGSAKRRLVIPHGSSVYSYHFSITSDVTPFSEFLMMAPQADQVIPMLDPMFEDEPVPVGGAMDVPDRPGFGVALNKALKWTRTEYVEKS
jgi:L-rhamnonate dehydratase